MDTILTKIEKGQPPCQEELSLLLSRPEEAVRNRLAQSARRVCEAHYGKAIYIRGLIEFTNYCKNDCYYCGIRRSNAKVARYRLTKDDILSCCAAGYTLGFRTFVLQGGEDGYYTDDRMADIVAAIRSAYPDCAITLSLGERSAASYAQLKAAGADRYLLRQETSVDRLYRHLHPPEMDGQNRLECQHTLGGLGYQLGMGFMVGAPGQTSEDLAQELLYMTKRQPQMIGIGPFIPHADTPFGGNPPGSLSQTLLCLSILRLLNPKALIPATTALGTIHPTGREQGIQAGANVVMPNLSPLAVRKQYSLYDNKICTGDEAAECLQCLGRRMESVDRHLVIDRGDALPS
ncbi:MAG: [FeFe] hydrogenase H-cluster radical SAM maturase HydE [Eubacterium aggregans]|uniref:[FeFe] hydrogenase H-cluster radical SAM maturase HydE n=1 Tax=Eubacterium aggregans TaxID=81409 RepID=UPI002B20142C|nr:[FeFe] hydrogenase H-cluster radical SAM maturase HydE [Eubacterium aggregans]MEA5073079.1 [FeFe] hydrogenase H-cluster radical SAM maturase HydE [Eubacterium aggregans]